MASTSRPATLTDELANASFAFLALMAFAVITIGKFRMDLLNQTHEHDIDYHSFAQLLTQGTTTNPTQSRRPHGTIAGRMFSILSN